MLKVKVSEEALEHVKNNGGNLVIFQGRTDGCCGGTIFAPSLELGKPRRARENYETVDLPGVKVYLAKELSSLPGLVDITLDRTLWWKRLSLRYIDRC